MRANHDVAYCLYGADLLFQGKTLYIDWTDINPPLIYYLGLFPALVSRILSVHLIFAFSLSVFALFTWSAFCMRRQLVHSGLEFTKSEIGVILACWVTFSLYCYQENDFGQRDHLFVLLFVPYFIFRWIRRENGQGRLTTAIVTGVAAGVGSCIKPDFLLVPLMCEAYWLVIYRRWGRIFQPEVVAFVLTALAYAGHFLCLPENVRKEWIDYLIPLARKYYSSFAPPQSGLSVLNHNELFASLVFAAIPFLAIPTRPSRLWNLARSSSIMVAGGVGIYLLHFKGFSYHFLTMLAGMSLVAGVVVAESRLFRLSDSPADQERFAVVLNKRRMVLIVLLFTVCIASMVGFRLWMKTPACFADNALSQILSTYSHKGDYVLVVADGNGITWPTLLQMERKQASRLGTFVAFPSYYRGIESSVKPGSFEYHTQSNAPKEEIRMLQDLEEDIRTFKPKLIVIYSPEQCQTCPKGFRMQDYFMAMGVLDRSMKDYRHDATVGEFSAYVPEDRAVP
jgi:hypothetical protein